jgi:hypothetical protein
MAKLGGMIAGSLTGVIGLQTCYFVDFATFLASEILIGFGVKGDFKVTHEVEEQIQSPGTSTIEQNDGHDHNYNHNNNNNNNNKNSLTESYKVLHDFVYLSTCGFGMMVFLKSSASFIWGIEDIVGAEFSTVVENDGTEIIGITYGYVIFSDWYWMYDRTCTSQSYYGC